jgi:hypothetical protein
MVCYGESSSGLGACKILVTQLGKELPPSKEIDDQYRVQKNPTLYVEPIRNPVLNTHFIIVSSPFGSPRGFFLTGIPTRLHSSHPNQKFWLHSNKQSEDAFIVENHNKNIKHIQIVSIVR